MFRKVFLLSTFYVATLLFCAYLYSIILWLCFKLYLSKIESSKQKLWRKLNWKISPTPETILHYFAFLLKYLRKKSVLEMRNSPNLAGMLFYQYWLSGRVAVVKIMCCLATVAREIYLCKNKRFSHCFPFKINVKCCTKW